MRGIHQHIEQSKNDRENGCDPGNSVEITFKISAFFMNIMIKKQAEMNRKKGQEVRMVRKDRITLNIEAGLKGRIRRNLSEMFILRRIENRYI